MPPKLIAKSAVLAGIDTLDERREELTAKFFKRHVLASSFVLHSLFPDINKYETGSSI